MTSKKAFEVDLWLSKPDLEKIIILLYGSNYGLVCERAKAFVNLTRLDEKNPFSVARLDANEANEGGRLLKEAQTYSIFERKRLLWIRHVNNQKKIADDIQKLSKNPPPNLVVVIEATDLKKSSTLRSFVEKASNAIALPCYPDSPRDIDVLIQNKTKNSNLQLTQKARSWVQHNLGKDRLSNRSELEKISLYGHGKKNLELDEVKKLIGDTIQCSIDEIIDALLAGNIKKTELLYESFLHSGGQASQIIGYAMRQFQNLYIMKIDLEEKKTTRIEEIITKRQPNLFFTRKPLVEKILQKSSEEQIFKILQKLQSSIRQTRHISRIGELVSCETLFSVTRHIRFMLTS